MSTPETSDAVPADFRVGMIAIVGRPNVGKSTLLNAIIGAHVSITSSKPQTTRHRVVGVSTQPDAQYVFVDTPGMQKQHRNLMTKRMNAGAAAAMQGVDAIVMVVDALQGWREEDDRILNMLPRPQVAEGSAADAPAHSHVILALNKTDLLSDRTKLLPLLEKLGRLYPFAAIVPVSAAKKRQLDDLLGCIRKLLPVGHPLYEPDDITDRSVRFLAAELIREQAFRLLGDELPYGLAVAIEKWEESEGRAVISALIQVERESQRGIVIGAGGSKLRDIGSRARTGIERLLGKPVFLETHVRVAAGWSDDARALDSLGVEAIRK